jgi:hypothetical protein
MSTVNDLMKYLNKTLSLLLPVLPLNKWTTALTNLWAANVTGWDGKDTPPDTVEVDLPSPINIAVGGGQLQMSQAHISITQTTPPNRAKKSQP